MRATVKAILKGCIWIVLFVKHKVFKAPLPDPKGEQYALEMEVVLDNKTVVFRFPAVIRAKSRKDAKHQMQSRARLRTRLVIKKSSLKKKQHSVLGDAVVSKVKAIQVLKNED